MEQLKSKYVTRDEFLAYSGIDLDARLAGDDNPSGKTEAFLLRIEERLHAFIAAEFARNVDREFARFSEYQKRHYKLAIMEQGIYEIRNGELVTDSGYDPDQGAKTSVRDLDERRIAPACKEQLLLCGLWCTHIRNGGTLYDGWLY